MRLTERQARIRLGHAVAAAGGQVAYAKRLKGLTAAAMQIAVSRSVLGRKPIHPLILADLGLRRDEVWKSAWKKDPAEG